MFASSVVSRKILEKKELKGIEISQRTSSSYATDVNWNPRCVPLSFLFNAILLLCLLLSLVFSPFFRFYFSLTEVDFAFLAFPSENRSETENQKIIALVQNKFLLAILSIEAFIKLAGKRF